MGGMDQNGLSGPMFYTLMALVFGDKCEIEILRSIYDSSHGQVTVWPGTLCAILDQLEAVDLVRKSVAERRRRIYALTEQGRRAYEAELQRLRACVDDALQAAALRKGRNLEAC